MARVCVEINILEKLQPDIPIQTDGVARFCKVQYEGVLDYCRICRHRGHSISSCYLKKERDEAMEDNITKETTGKEELKETEDLRAKLEKKRGKKPMVEIGDGTTSISSIGDSKLTPTSILMRKLNQEVIIPLENEQIGKNIQGDCGDKMFQSEGSLQLPRRIWIYMIRNSDSEDDEVEGDERQLLPLCYKVDIPNIEETGEGSMESEDSLWQEVSSKKHRRAASLDDNSINRR
ncbi:hypothetical protein BUALT_Bualt18G0069500 [Buddleja alternifolia]|uniref:Uncharacterized protein n=1 Tax=Buddleja alternifolia TaxID=168488 RepID=A0AAV6WBM3_9LAMI|nr:hypothetical protein BUALT_Bualt18G0069500 [Buddleja alternifolia]